LVRLKLLRCDMKETVFESPEEFLAFMIQIAKREVSQAKRKERGRGKQGRQAPKSLDCLSPSEDQQLVDTAPDVFAVEAAKEQWRNALAGEPLVYRVIGAKNARVTRTKKLPRHSASP